jgi:probable F420-dependent oxidoreductase
VRLGFASPNTPTELPVTELAVALEERGFESLWVGEHPQIPVSRRTPYPAGGELPGQYWSMMDPFVSLGAAAAVTTQLVLGTAVALPLEHDLLALGKAVATLDRICGGRLELGVGAGWNVEELAVHRPDIPWRHRYRAVGEAVVALRRLWTEEEVAFEGEFFGFEALRSEPKPSRAGGPPVLFGGAGRVGVGHTAAWADGWMPLDIGLGRDVAAVARRLESFRDQAEQLGRDPATLPVSLVAWADPATDLLRAYEDLGVHRCIIGALRTDWGNRATTLSFLDRYSTLC